MIIRNYNNFMLIIALTIFSCNAISAQNYTQYTIYEALSSGSMNWADAGAWDNGIPQSCTTTNLTERNIIIIPSDVYMNFDIPNNYPGGGSSNPLNRVVIQVYGRLALQGGDKLYLGCESSLIVYPEAFLSGEGNALGEKVWYCDNDYKWVWEANQYEGGEQEGYFYLGANDLPMPVELLFFKAENNDGETQLNWATASEKNNNYFVIERAGSALDYEMIGIVGGSGNTNAPVYYSFTDQSGVLSGTLYYRLTQFDYDGSSEVIGQIAVDHTALKDPESILFQNPIQSHENLEIVLLNESSGNLKIFTIEGTQVFQAPFSPSSGKVQAGTLKPGMYVVVYESAGKATAYKLAVL